MILAILIPTYNRSKYLIKNIELLTSYIRYARYESEVEIIISNNSSIDDTQKETINFINQNPDIQIKYFQQELNIGLEKNALFVLEKAGADFVMYVGDDDYIDYEFFIQIFDNIKKYTTLTGIICNPIAMTVDGTVYGNSRDYLLPNRIFKPGFRSCLINSWRGHQLSGLTLRRSGLIDNFRLREVSNIYLFIFLLSITCLTGTVVHITQFPVKVTQPPQQLKDWNYGNDGLLNDVYNNYKKLPVNDLKRSLLQLYFFNQQAYRLMRYRRNGFKYYAKAINRVWFASNGCFFYKLLFPFLLSYKSLKSTVSNSKQAIVSYLSNNVFKK